MFFKLLNKIDKPLLAKLPKGWKTPDNEIEMQIETLQQIPHRIIREYLETPYYKKLDKFLDTCDQPKLK